MTIETEDVVGRQGDPTQFGDDVAEKMRAYFDAHKNDRWRRGTADSLMLGLFNIAARAVGERYNDQLCETQMRAHKWMEAHDKLKAGKPYTFPEPADLPTAVQSLSDRIDVLREGLRGIERIAEKHTGISGARSLQAAMYAISHAARALTKEAGIHGEGSDRSK